MIKLTIADWEKNYRCNEACFTEIMGLFQENTTKLPHKFSARRRRRIESAFPYMHEGINPVNRGINRETETIFIPKNSRLKRFINCWISPKLFKENSTLFHIMQKPSTFLGHCFAFDKGTIDGPFAA